MRSRKRSGNGALGTVLAAVGGTAAVFVCVAVTGFVMTIIDISDSVLSVLTSAALCVGSYFGGYIAAKRRRQSGLLMGMLCGLMMFGVIFAGSYIFAGAAGGFSGSAKLVMTLLFGAAGGIIGVNSKSSRFRLK